MSLHIKKKNMFNSNITLAMYIKLYIFIMDAMLLNLGLHATSSAEYLNVFDASILYFFKRRFCTYYI